METCSFRFGIACKHLSDHYHRIEERREMGGERTSTKRMTHTQQTGGEGGKMQSIYATERLEDETGGRGGNDKKQTARLGVGSILSTKTRDRVKRRRDFFITWLLNDY